MPVRGHVVVSGVDEAVLPHPDVEHCGAEDVSGVVGLDFGLVVVSDHLVQVDGHHLLHAVLDHLGGEKVCLALPFHSNFSDQIEKKHSTPNLDIRKVLPTYLMSSSKMGQIAFVGCVM